MSKVKKLMPNPIDSLVKGVIIINVGGEFRQSLKCCDSITAYNKTTKGEN